MRRKISTPKISVQQRAEQLHCSTVILFFNYPAVPLFFRLPCCAIILLFAYFFFCTCPAVPLFFCALTLLYSVPLFFYALLLCPYFYFAAHLPCGHATGICDRRHWPPDIIIRYMWVRLCMRILKGRMLGCG